MPRYLFHVILAIASLVVTTSALAQPANDECVNAEVVTLGSVNGTNVAATGTNLSSCAGTADTQDVWYLFTPNPGGAFVFDTESAFTLDTTMALFSTCGGPELTCNDDGGTGLKSRIVWGLATNEPLYIRIAGFNGTTGSFTLNITQVTPPVNDTCAGATVIGGIPFSDTLADFNNALPDVDVGCNLAANTSTRHGVWYTYTPSADCTGTLNETGGNDIVLAIFTGSDCNSLSEVSCSAADSTTFAMTASTQYWILIGMSSETVGPEVAMTFNFDCALPAANDQCSGATVISSLPFSESVNHLTATHDQDIGCNAAANVETRYAVWYTYTPTQNCVAHFSETTTNDIALAVFAGSDCNSLTEVHCSGAESSAFAMTANTQYWILIGMASATTVPTIPIQFNLNDCSDPIDGDFCTNAKVIASTPYSDSADHIPASDDPDVSCNSTTDVVQTNRGLWYTYTPTADCTGQINETSTNDIFTAIYTGACGSLTEVFCSAAETSSFSMTANTQYWILVGMFSGVTVPTISIAFNFDCALPASNDQCGTATIISSLPFSESVNHVTATNDQDIGCNAAANTETRFGVWYTYTPTQNCVAHFSETSTNDIALAVFSGSDCNSLTEVHCSGAESSAIYMTANTQYWILIGMASATVVPTIPIQFNLNDCSDPIDGDLCTNAKLISSTPYSDAADHLPASDDPDVSCNSTTDTVQSRHGIWYTYTPTADCSGQFNETSTNDIFTAVFTGGCGGLSEVFCSAAETSSFAMSANTQYWILVGMFSGVTVPTVSIVFNFDCVQPPPNDECANAIPAVVGTQTGTNIGASGTDITSCALADALDVWYIFTANQTGNWTFDTETSAMADTTLALFDACGGTQLACDDDGGTTPPLSSRIVFSLAMNQTVYIRVAGYNGTSGNFTLNITAPPTPPANDDCATATVITSVPFSDSLFNNGAVDDPDVTCNAAAATVTKFGVWYAYTPAATCVLNVAETSTQNVVIALFAADCVTELACVDNGTTDTASFNLTGATSYRILVGQQGTGTTPPTVALNLNFDCLPPIGACCIGSNCSALTQLACASQSGSYQGDFTSCDITYEQSTIALDFTDIAGTGTPIPGVNGTDDGISALLPLNLGAGGPFSFNFYGIAYTSCYFSANSFLSFSPITAGVSSYVNTAIPNVVNPNNAIYALWDDLNSSGGGTIVYQVVGSEPNRVLIVQWTNVPQFVNVGTNTFQMKLFEGTNVIEYHYSFVDGTESVVGDLTTVGVENLDGSAATQFDTPATTRATLSGGNTALRYTPMLLTNCAGCTLPGDMDNSTTVDGKDIAGFVPCYISGDPSGACACANMDADTDVDSTDLNLFVTALLAP